MINKNGDVCVTNAVVLDAEGRNSAVEWKTVGSLNAKRKLERRIANIERFQTIHIDPENPEECSDDEEFP